MSGLRRNTNICIAASALSLAVDAGSAQAQTAPAAGNSAPAADAPTAGPTQEAAIGGDIVVTARRREENVQRVPIAITAFSGDALKRAQVVDAKGLEQLVPSLNINSGNSREGARYTLRGQGASLAAGESVAVYLSEAPIPQFISGGPGFYYDLANVQVLNGPQGTLFGRNTTGGAVLFTPRMPTNDLNGFVDATYGNYDNRELNGALNVPIVDDRILLRVSGTFRKRDGFTLNRFHGNHNDNLDYWSGRAILTINLTDNLKNSTIYSYIHSTSNGTGFVLDYLNPAGPIRFVPSFLALAQAERAARQTNGPRVTNSDADSFYRTRAHALVNTTTLNLGELTFKNIFSYFKTRLANGFDLDGTPAPLIGYLNFPDSGQPSAGPQSNENYYTNEFQIQGTALDKKFNWVTGAFYNSYDPAGFTQIHFLQFGVNTIITARDAGHTTALFAQGTLDLGALTPALDQVKLTGGYRYTWDTRRSVSSPYRVFDGLCVGTGGASGFPARFFPNCSTFFAKKYSQGTYTFGLDWQVTSRTLLYATTRRGYKSGGFNTNAPVNAPFAAFEPETVTDYELGLKTEQQLGTVPLRINLALFRDNYKNIQRSQTVIIPNTTPPVTTAVTLNAASARIQGAEAQIRVEPFAHFIIDGFYSYLDSRYRSYTFSGVNLRGVELPYSPKHKFSFSPSYTLPLPASSQLVLRGTYSFQSTYRASDVDQPGNLVGHHGIVNLGADLNHVAGSAFDLSVFVTNVTNNTYVSQPLPYYFTVGTTTNAYGEPRMYGLRVRYSF